MWQAQLPVILLLMILIDTSNQAPLLTDVRQVSNYSLNLVFGSQCATKDEFKDDIEPFVEDLIHDIRDLKNDLFLLTKGTLRNPGNSCKELHPSVRSGHYWIRTELNDSLQSIYCDMERKCCGNTGGWMKIANLDMTNPNHQCPDGFRLINRPTAPLRTCGRPNSLIGCVSTTFPVYGITYSHVCGRIVGYQVGHPDAFYSYNHRGQTTVDGFYMDGISITHGQPPRQHIWSFVGAVGEGYTYDSHVCPCVRTSGSYGGTVPSFIGQDYFCDTAVRGGSFTSGLYYPDDPLWDGQGCGSTSICCSFNNPPWFCKRLPQPTTDDIEVRICDQQLTAIDDIPIEIIELYVK